MIRTGWPLLCLQLPLLLTLVGCEARDAVHADPFACSAPGDCAAGFACLVDRCVPEAELACGADGDCPTPWICESGRCEPPRGGRCRPEAGVCAAGFSCVDQRCVADGVCRDDSDCAVGSVCGPAQVCVGCVVDDHCPPGQRCIAEACGDGCRGDRDCRAEQICEANRCQDGCRMDSDCAQGRICEGGACQDGCQGADDCAPGERCELGRCKPGEACSDDGDCPGDLACREGACVPLACEDVSDCPDGVSWGCVEGTCVRGGCQLAGACEVGGIRCVHTPALVCDAGRQRLTWGGLCEEMGEGDDLQCVADTSGPPRQIEALTDCPAGQHCVEGAAGEAACAPRGECDCTGRRDHARCLFDEGRCVLQACRGWQCDQPDCNSRGPWFPFPFAERLEPFEVLADVAGHTVRGERFMDVEWAFPPPDVRKGSQWEGHVHCSTLGEATPGAAQDWRLPTVHELLTLSQRDADAVAPPRPALARTAVGDGLLAVYLTEPPDGRARVRQFPHDAPPAEGYWPVCVRPAFPVVEADLPALDREGPGGGLPTGVDPWTGARWRSVGGAEPVGRAGTLCGEQGARLPTAAEAYSLLDFHPRQGAAPPVDVLTGRHHDVGSRLWVGLRGVGLGQVDLGSGELFTAELLPVAELRCVQVPCEANADCGRGQVCAGGFCQAVDCQVAEEHTPCVDPAAPDGPARCVMGDCCAFDRADALCNELGPSFRPPRGLVAERLRPQGAGVFADSETGLVWHDTGADGRTVEALHRLCANLRRDADGDGAPDTWRLPTLVELASLRPSNLVALPALLSAPRLYATRTMLGNGFFALDLAEMRSRTITPNAASAGALCVAVAPPANTWPRPRAFAELPNGNGSFEDPWTGWRVRTAGFAETRALAAVGCSARGLLGEVWQLPTAAHLGLLVRYYQRPVHTVTGEPEVDSRAWLDELRLDGLAGDRVVNLESGQIEAAPLGRAHLIRCVAPPVAGGQE